MLPLPLRMLFVAAVLVLGLGLGCGPGAAPRSSADGKATACTSETLAACEEAIALAVRSGDPVGPLVSAYASAREERDSDDAMPAFLATLTEAAKRGRAVLVVPRGAPRPTTDVVVVEAGAAWSTTSPDNEPAVLLAIAEAAGLDYLAIVEPKGRTRRYFPRDPLAPMMLGVFAYAADDHLPPSLATDGALEAAIRSAAGAARAFQYVDAAKAIDELDALVVSRPAFDPHTVRARLLSNLLGMSKPTPMFADPPDRPAPPEPAANETPYVDLLRVRTDPASAKAYAKRRVRLLEALPPDLRAGAEALFADAPAGCEAFVPPPIKSARDLAFARLLPGALRPARARSAAGRLEFGPWYQRYADLVATVERTDSGFLFAPVLVLERGGASGVVPSGSDVHRRATKIALRHAKALSELASAMPGRVGLAHSGFFLSSGSYTDPDLAAAVVDAGRNAASGVLSTSDEPWEVLGATLASAFLAFSMPPELQQAHLAALQGAFAAKLRGELAKQTGWGVATAFALDALYRQAFGMGPNLHASAEQVSRALEAEGVENAALASLTSALVRYAVLADKRELGSPVIEREAPLPGRAAARSALGKALSRLGDDGVAPSPKALEDVTLLLDGAAATLALFVSEALRGEPNAAASTAKEACLDDSTPVDPRVVRALGKLADLRKRALQNKAIQEGTDAWSTRARALTLVVSDVVDVAQASLRPLPKGKPGAKTPLFHPTTFFVSRGETGKILLAALASFGADKPSGEAFASGYALLRAVAEGKADTFDIATLAEAKTFLSAIGALFADSKEMSETGALFTILARAISGDAQASPAFVDVARSLYAKGSRDQADMVLLLAVIIASIEEKQIHPTAIVLADEQRSDMAWVLKYLREARRIEGRDRLEPTSFAPGLDALLLKSCTPAKAEVVSSLLAAIDAHRGGDKQGARLALDAWLDRAEQGLVIPRASFVFKQETATRVFNLTLDVGLAGILVSGANGFNFGVGARTSGEPLLSLTKSVEPPDSKRSRDEAGRAFIHAAALAGVMHFAAGDPNRGEIAAARAIAASTQRTRLYLEGVSDEPPSWTVDARATLLLLGQMAADSGRPFLAGSLFALVRDSMGTAAKPEEFQKLLDPTPSLVADLDLGEAVGRAKKTLATLPAGLPCGARRSDTAALLRPSCDGYATALALRIADATVALPQLDKKSAKACGDFAAVDAFLQGAAKGTYEPDRLMAAASSLVAADKPYEAATLLTKQRQPNHCTPPLLALVRKTAARLERAPALHADLLSVAVNCEASSPSPALVTDLEALDGDLGRLGDPARRLDVSLFAAKLALVHGSADALRAVALRPGFLSEARESGAGPLGVALLLDHAASALSGAKVRTKETQDDVDLLCGRVPPADRIELCRLLDPLRSESTTTEARKKAADEALRKLLGP